MTKRSWYLQFTRRTLMLAFAVLFLLSQSRVRATNHFVHITEVMAGANGNSKVQFIVIDQEASGQNLWGPNGAAQSRAMLVFFDATGRETGKFKFPANPPTGGTLRTLIATQDFANLPGAPAPDVTIPPLLNAISGKVCFKHNPANIVFQRNECLSYGSFTGNTEINSGGADPSVPAGPPAADLPIINTVSLKRTLDTDRNSDFVITSTPTPTNIAGATFTIPAANQVTQGENLFKNETFLGNGRTCASCHVASLSFRLTPTDVQERFAKLSTDSTYDPLFIAETAPSSFDPGFDFNLNTLVLTAEVASNAPCTGELRGLINAGAGRAKVLTRVSPTTYLVYGGISPALSGTVSDLNSCSGTVASITMGNLKELEDPRRMRKSVSPDFPNGRALILENIDGFTNPPVFRKSPHFLNMSRTAPFGFSSNIPDLQTFAKGAVTQHLPRTLTRNSSGPNPDFRLPTPAELAAMEAFMLAQEFPAGTDPDKFNLNRFAITAAQQRGRDALLGAAKCSQCHGGTVLSGVNANFNTGVVNQPINGPGQDNLPCEPSVGTCGSRAFNVPQLFNVKNLVPLFHDASAANVHKAVEFYTSVAFNNSPEGKAIGGISMPPDMIDDITAFLEGLSVPEPPATNDNFPGFTLTGRAVTTTGSNVGFTVEPGEPSDGISSGRGTPSAWWTWTAPCSFTVTQPTSFIDTIGSNFDTVLGVFTGPSLDKLSLFAADDDSSGSFRTSRVPSTFPGPSTLNIVAGTVFHIRVRSFFANITGNITLNINSCVPTITGIIPNSGAQSTILRATITGTNLDGVIAADFGSGVTARIESGGTATNLPVTITIAADATLGSRTVTLATPTQTSPPFCCFTVNPSVPVITVITPTSGAQATTVAARIMGDSLNGATQVKFSGTGITAPIGSGGGTATSLPVMITIAPSAPPGPRTMTVTTPGGTSPDFCCFTVTPQLTLQPTINDLAATPPGLSQAVVPFLGGPFTLVVNGQNLQGGVVSVDAVGVGTGFVAAFPTELSADITTDILSSPGARGVSVTKPGSLISNIVNLNVVRHGDVNSNGSVTIADALVTALTVGGIVKPPLPMSIGDVNLNASANIGDALEIALLAGRMKADWDVPQVSSVSPAPAMRGNTLTITGTGFAATPSDNLVFFTVPNNGAVRVIPTAGTVTTLTVMVPNDALSGPMQVYRRDVPLGGREFPLIVAGATISLALTRVNPYFQVQVGATVTLEGMGFDATPGNNTVLFKSATGTIAAVVTAASTTSLTVTVPTGAVCGPVTVVTPSLQTSNQRMVTISGTSCGVQLADIWGAGSSGDTLVLEGAGFDVVNPGNNGVRFASSAGGTVTAPVLAAGGTQLHVRVPDTAIEGNVTVTVGSTTSNAVLYRTPPRMTPSSVAVVISGPEALGSYQVTIGFNKNIVTVNPANVKGGTGAGFTGNPTTVNVDNNMGVVTINHFQVGNSPTGLFTVANITFTPVAVGTTNLSLFGISLTDTSGGNLPNRLSLSSPTVTVLRVP